MAATDPFALFDAWMAEARASEPNDPDAMAFASADAEGRPSVRMVLLRRAGPEGFGFFTNLDSRKGDELVANPHGALAIHWKSLRRQVRAEGPVEQVSEAEADAYFASRLAGIADRVLGVGPVAPAGEPRGVRGALCADAAQIRRCRTCRGRRAGRVSA